MFVCFCCSCSCFGFVLFYFVLLCFFHQGILRFLHPHISSYNMKRLFYSKIVSEASPGWLWYAWVTFRLFRIWELLLVHNGSSVHKVMSLLVFLCSVTLCRPKQDFVSVSPVISGLNFDEGGKVQGCRNPRNLTKCKLFTKTTYKVCKEVQKYLICQ